MVFAVLISKMSSIAMNRQNNIMCHAILLCPLVVTVGCEDTSTSPSEATQAVTIPAPPPSRWEEINGEAVVALTIGEDDPELQEAIEQARASAEDARIRWERTPLEMRHHWAIKWAAETEDNRVEFVWIIPDHWSPYRIEGTLASAPVTQLACGKTQNERVGFPSEELADWIYLIDGITTGPHDGGFTVTLLENRFGPPHTTPTE